MKYAYSYRNCGVYIDRSNRGGGRLRHYCYRAVAIIAGKRVRKRFRDRQDALAWLRGYIHEPRRDSAAIIESGKTATNT